MRNETIEIIGAIILIVGAATLFAAVNKKRRARLLRSMDKYSNIPRFIEHQLNSTHKR